MTTKFPHIVWFRNDLRLTDHPALHAAALSDQPLIALYIFDDEVAGKWKAGGAARWWLHYSLMDLQRQLASHGGTLILRRGDSQTIIQQIATETKAKNISWNRRYESFARRQEEDIAKSLASQDIEVETFNGSLLNEPWEIANKQGKSFKVFTPYWNTCLKIEPPQPLPLPKNWNFYSHKLQSDKLDDWQLLPTKPNWAKDFSDLWQPGESHVKPKLESFLHKRLADYDESRDVPSEAGTSQMSPYLHFGELSPRTLWKTLQSLNCTGAALASKNRYLAEIGWREFSYYLLYHFPQLPEKSFDERFLDFPWHDSPGWLRAWEKGLTGYPIVDAGMRQLWQTGWMHNRVRMIAASFLTKDLLISWQRGATWFWDTLVDADLANNSASWQWVAGCGADAAPYFRIFNPVLQGQKFDPKGEYVRKWVPELKDVPDKYIHSPWEASPMLLRSYGITLGQSYPFPIVDHAKARLKALELMKQH